MEINNFLKTSLAIDPKFIEEDSDVVLKELNTTAKGLSQKEATKRLLQYGKNDPLKKEKRGLIMEFCLRLVNPLVIVLFVISIFSFIFGEKISAILVAVMAFMSVIISFVQEYKAGKDAERLIDMVRLMCDVYRDGKEMNIKMHDVVPGDVVVLSAGDMIPADMRIISSKDLFINQSTFTGESFPTEKFADKLMKGQYSSTSLLNVVLMGSSIVSGTAEGVVLLTGSNTELGRISQELQDTAPITAFDKGVRSFTMLMIKFMFVLALAVFAINASSKGNIVEAFLFALAVAVGLAPEMLPMEVALNLSKGAIDMARKGIIVKRLDSMQNFGAMDILCTDKTGTLTQDDITLVKHINALAQEDEDVLRFAFVNSYYQTGLHNVLDAAVLKFKHLAVTGYEKIDEIPFDFKRRVMSVVVAMDHTHRIITKGAPEEILKRCNRFEIDGKVSPLTSQIITNLEKEYDVLSADGFRVLAIGYDDCSIDTCKNEFSASDENDLIFKGYICFLDPAKPTVAKTIEGLEKLGIVLKILTGDNELVTKKICGDVGLDAQGMITGDEIEKLNDVELAKAVEKMTIFARVNPLQKERVIMALQANKHIVGFLGDGINDAPALKAADVGISVNNAVGIAKDTADIILLRKSLTVLKECVVEGRKTFGNIIKYIKMGASSNFGNMFSMTGASLLLPFLPMRPIQILLNNFLYDMSQVSLPSDMVDDEYIENPRPWNIDYIKKFMLFIGPISSLFDYLTFALMWFFFHANTVASQAVFNTGWFLESLTSQTLVIYVLRTNKIPFLESNPSKALVITTLSVLTFAYILASTKFGSFFGFTPLPWSFFVILFFMMVVYLSLVQIVKKWFLKKYGNF